MSFAFHKSARLLALSLAASMAFGSTALAVNTIDEKDAEVPMVSEEDIPLTVTNMEAGTAMGVGTVEAAGLSIRDNPNEDAAVLAVAENGQHLVVLAKEGDWYWVSCNGVTGFVHSRYLTLETELAADLGYGVVLADSTEVHIAPDCDSDIMEYMEEEDVICITGVMDGWYQATFDNGSIGYIRSENVDPTAEIPAERIFNYAVISSSAVNLRVDPDTDAELSDVLYDGSLCTLVQQVGDWYEVQYGETTGYVLASLTETTNDESEGSSEIETLNEATAREAEETAKAQAEQAAKAEEEAKVQAEQAAKAEETAKAQAEQAAKAEEEAKAQVEQTAQAPASQQTASQSVETSAAQEETVSASPASEETASAPASSASSSIVSVAKQYLGVPYVWGGTSPSGFDCSGFVQYVFRQCGYSISRTASAQYSCGTPVSYSNLQPGDLVFFERTYATNGISHVGIYIGSGQFIHAASGGVKISSLSDSYYSSRYYGACRIA